MTMKQIATLFIGFIGLAACAAIPSEPVPASISYRTGPCFGRCPVYRVTVRSDLTGTFEGERFTAVTGPREFRVSARQWRAFVAKLAPLRPRGVRAVTPGSADCGQTVTDMPSVNVSWSGASADRLDFYYGCRAPANQTLADTLRAAPELLPIGDYIGSRG
jgi:hypothetical protein